MNLKKEVLEKGVIIKPDGTIEKYQGRDGLQKEELFVIFSDIGLRTEIKIDGQRNLAHRETVVITKTMEQAMMEAILIQFYSLGCFKEKRKSAGDG